MTTGAGSKQHGLHRVKRLQPSSKLRKKKNKANNRVRQQERQAAIITALSA